MLVTNVDSNISMLVTSDLRAMATVWVNWLKHANPASLKFSRCMMRKFRAIIFHLYTTRFQSYINQWNNEVSQIPELKKFQNRQKSTCESYHNYENLFHNILGHWSHVGVDIRWMRTGFPDAFAEQVIFRLHLKFIMQDFFFEGDILT